MSYQNVLEMRFLVNVFDGHFVFFKPPSYFESQKISPLYFTQSDYYKTLQAICTENRPKYDQLGHACNKVNFSNPKSDQHLISPRNNTAEPFTKVMRTKEMMANLRSFYC